jgi:hypothetical protein
MALWPIQASQEMTLFTEVTATTKSMVKAVPMNSTETTVRIRLMVVLAPTSSPAALALTT